jgi:hypothetical protein
VQRRDGLALLGVVAGGVWLWWSDTTFCPTAGLFGVPCPSCGLTRATVALLVGRPRQAASLHLGVFLVLPYLACLAAHWAWAKRRSGPFGDLAARWLNWVGVVVLALLVLLWAARFFGFFGGPVPVKRWY